MVRTRRTRPWMVEVAVLLACAVALGGALIVMFKTSGDVVTDGASGVTSDSTTGAPTLRSSTGDERDDLLSTGSDAPPMQIRIRSPEAAPGLVNDAAGALFIETNMAPGTTSTRCVAVKNIGQQLGDVRLFSIVNDKGLAPHLSFVIEAGTGGSDGDCEGFKGTEIYRGSLAQLASGHRDFGTGLKAPQHVYPNESVAFRLTQTLAESSPQAATAEARFAWESHGAGAPSHLTGRDPLPHQEIAAPKRRPHAVGRSVAQVVLEAATEAVKRGWSFMALLGLVVLFLVIQDRIDRRDPRLAGARVHPEPDMPFTDHLKGSTRTSEAIT